MQPPGVMDPHPCCNTPPTQTDAAPRGDAPPSLGPHRCHSGLAAGRELPQLPPGLPAGAGRDASPAHPVPVPAPGASSTSRCSCPIWAGCPRNNPRIPAPGAAGTPAPRRGPPHPKGDGLQGGCEEPAGLNRPVVQPGVGTARAEPHKSASRSRMGSFVPGKGLSHPGRGDAVTRVAMASPGPASLAPTGVFSIAARVPRPGCPPGWPRRLSTRRI